MKQRRLLSLAAVFVLIGLLLVAAFAKSSQNSAQQATPSPKPTSFTPADLAKLRWIEGTWRGTGDVDKPFYERYRLDGTTALLVDGFDDEKVDKVTDTTRFELKDGQLTGGGGQSVYAATEITNDSITFEPVIKARNSFTWKRESKDVWQAILKWPASEGKPARQRVYRMERWPPVK